MYNKNQYHKELHSAVIMFTEKAIKETLNFFLSLSSKDYNQIVIILASAVIAYTIIPILVTAFIAAIPAICATLIVCGKMGVLLYVGYSSLNYINKNTFQRPTAFQLVTTP